MGAVRSSVRKAGREPGRDAVTDAGEGPKIRVAHGLMAVYAYHSIELNWSGQGVSF